MKYFAFLVTLVSFLIFLSNVKASDRCDHKAKEKKAYGDWKKLDQMCDYAEDKVKETKGENQHLIDIKQIMTNIFNKQDTDWEISLTDEHGCVWYEGRSQKYNIAENMEPCFIFFSETTDKKIKVASLIKNQQLIEAVRTLKSLHNDDPEDLYALYMCGVYVSYIEDAQQGKEYFDKAIKLYPDNPKLRAARAIVYEKLKDHDSAANEVKESRNLDPTLSFLNAEELRWLQTSTKVQFSDIDP